MQKVEGSSPFIRLSKRPANAGLFCFRPTRLAPIGESPVNGSPLRTRPRGNRISTQELRNMRVRYELCL